MRAAPYPLSIHLGILAAKEAGMQEYVSQLPYMSDQSLILNVIKGIQLYQNHPFKNKELPTETVLQIKHAKLVKPLGDFPKINNKTPLIFVPSLINSADILDIHEQFSMLRWFRNQGRDVYLLKWELSDENNQESQNLTVENIIKALGDIIQSVSKEKGTEVDMLGYCMGGTILTAANAIEPSYIRTMTLLATPWNFAVKDYSMAQNIRIWQPFVTTKIQEKGYLPKEWLQALFASFDPDGSMQKFADFAHSVQTGASAELFISVEDWLNNNVNLPYEIAHHCIQKWFVNNAPIKDEWVVGGNKIDLNNITSPTLIVAPTKDRIVPKNSAIALEKSLKNHNVKVKTISPETGHVGMIVGKKSIPEVYEPILSFLS